MPVPASNDPRPAPPTLKRSADKSEKRRAGPFRSAISMPSFYINRAGSNLPADRKKVLEDAKDELRKAYGRPAGA